MSQRFISVVDKMYHSAHTGQFKFLLSAARLGNHDTSVERLGSRTALVASRALLLTNIRYALGSHMRYRHM